MNARGEVVAGRYEIIRPLDRGGMGQVLLARQLSLGRLVVVKRAGDKHSTHERQAIVDEARMAARLHHPNVVTIFDVHDVNDEPIVVMELVAGVSLREMLDRTRAGLPIEVALAITSDLLRGLAYAHSARSGEHTGVVHRDIKPRNVMVTFAGITKLIDFGISRWLEPGGHEATSVAGTRGYMAPEQHDGQRIDGRADQYAVGVTLREMIGSDTPLDGILARSCSASPAARFADCNEMLVAIEAYAAAHTIVMSASVVERWMAQHFADRKGDLETDAGAGPRYVRADSPTTVVLGQGKSATHDELAAQKRLGASTQAAYAGYEQVVHEYLSTSLPDSYELADAARAVIAADPEWAHPYALLVHLQGKVTEAARTTLADARRHADPQRDPSGFELIAAYEHVARHDFASAFDLMLGVSHRDPSDLLAAYESVLTAVALQRSDEATAITRRLHRDYPQLMFGIDLAEACRRAGRDSDAERVAREWLETDPTNVLARPQLARVEAAADRLELAAEHARRAWSGAEQDVQLADIFDCLVAADCISDARAVADQMLMGSPLTRARGRYRVAVASVFEGRFAAAYDSIRRAIDEHRPFGHQSELVQCLELARSIASLVADVDAKRRFTSELASCFTTLVGDSGATAALRYELLLLGPGRPPPIEECLAGLPDGPIRDVAHRRMLRAAAIADHGAPHKAVAAGFSGVRRKHCVARRPGAVSLEAGRAVVSETKLHARATSGRVCKARSARPTTR